jgi:hypothetical protein
LNRKQHGFLNGSIIAMLIGGLALGGLLLYGSMTGQELPIWPAIAVGVVNLVAAGKVFFDARKARKLRQEQNLNRSKADQNPR